LTVTPLTGVRSSSVNAEIRRRARAHSRLVFALRWLLPTFILAMLGLLGAFVVADAMRAAAARPKELPTQIRMISPHFLGRDDQGRAFNLAARLAVRDDSDMQRVHLTFPVMVLDVDSDHPKTLTADHGVYDEDTRMLRLKGHVRVDDSTASTAGTDEALVDTRAGTVSGASPVSGAGPMGQIHAGSYTALQKGQIIVMHGGVHAVLKGH
jgi:lipopolysaccharide export system protein LptC